MDQKANGLSNCLIGVIIFSGSLPATRVAVGDFDPIFLTTARAALAAMLGLFFLLILKQIRPTKADLPSLLLVSIGVVVGFPLLTALALQHINAAHSLVFIGLLPLSTAIFGVIRDKDRPSLLFWIFSLVGAATVAGFALLQSGGGTLVGDGLMLLAIVLCGLGYAEGAKLSKKLGGWQVISWALLLSLPLMGVGAMLSAPQSWSTISTIGWLGFAYVSTFSMLIGFIFWYRGLAIGGISNVSQLQLLQPFIGLTFAAFLLHETIHPNMIIASAIVIMCVVGTRRFG
jgi:drug/metabolite transporter (DMT)-like permease